MPLKRVAGLGDLLERLQQAGKVLAESHSARPDKRPEGFVSKKEKGAAAPTNTHLHELFTR